MPAIHLKRLAELIAVVARLLDPASGSLDLEQPHTSWCPYVLEEAHEWPNAIRHVR